jgi:hypothetical protein
MIEVGLGLLAVLPQADERIDFDLEPGVILTAVLFFVLVNVLLGAVLYPYLKDGGLFGEETSTEQTSDQRDLVEEAPSDDDEALEKKVDDFLQDIHGERST